MPDICLFCMRVFSLCDREKERKRENSTEEGDRQCERDRERNRYIENKDGERRLTSFLQYYTVGNISFALRNALGYKNAPVQVAYMFNVIIKTKSSTEWL